jgi:hypothetical protein
MPWMDALVYIIVALACWRVLVYLKPQWQKLLGKSSAHSCGDCGGCVKSAKQP